MVPVKSLGTARALSGAGPALLRDAVNSAGMGTSIPLSSAGLGHTHTHVPPSNLFIHLFCPNEQRAGEGGAVPDFFFLFFSLFSRPRAGLATV